MAKAKLKSLLPSLREKKRYLAYEVISQDRLDISADVSEISEAILDSSLSYMGELGASEAGLMVLADKYNPKKQRGLIRVAHRSAENLKAALSLISAIGGQDVVVRSVGVSGIMKKAYDNYVAG